MDSSWRTHVQRLASKLDPRARGKLTFPALIARAPMVANVVLGLVIAAQAADIALTLSGEMTTGAVPATETMAGQVRGKPAMALTDIMSAHLFGLAPQGMTAGNTKAASASPLVLTGIIASGDPHDGYAILGASVTNTHTVYVGSEAAPGAVLVEVHPLWVVVQRGGERLTLRLPHKSLMASAGGNYAWQQPVQRPQAAVDDESGSDEAFELPAPLAKPPTPDSGVVVSAFQLSRTSIGGTQGMRISGTGVNRKVLASLGLVGGDVITQINGIPVGASNAPDLINAIQSGSATLTVVKNGEASSVTLDQGSVASAAALYRQAYPDF